MELTEYDQLRTYKDAGTKYTRVRVCTWTPKGTEFYTGQGGVRIGVSEGLYLNACMYVGRALQEICIYIGTCIELDI